MKTFFLTVLTFISLLNSNKAYSQEIRETQINNNLDELFINKDNPFGNIPENTVNLYFEDTPRLYYFEIEYNEKIIFREGIEKSVPQSRDSETMSNLNRFKYYKIYLDASLISDSDKLKLLESYNNGIIEISGKKILALNNYEIIKKDYRNNKYVINNPLENMKIKIYKIEFQ